MSTAEHVVPVLNNEDRAHMIQLPGASGKGGVTLGPLIKLIPGINFIAADQWAKAKENPGVKRLLTEKIKPSQAPEQNQERVGSVKLVEGKPVGKDNPLADIPQPDAVEMVGDINDTALLHGYLDQETRGPVVTALKQQIARLEKPSQTSKKK